MISLFNYLDQNKEDLKYNNPDSLFGYAWGMTKEAINLQSDTASDILNAGLDGAVSLFNIDTEPTPAPPATDKADLGMYPMGFSMTPLAWLPHLMLGEEGIKVAGENLPGSAINVARGFTELITSPVDAVTGIAQTVEGGLLKAMPDSWKDTTVKIGKAFGHDFEASIEQFNDFVEWGAGRYGTPEDFRRTVIEDPLGFMVDAWMTGGLAKLGLRTAKDKMPNFTPEMQGQMVEAIQNMNLTPIRKSTLPFDPTTPIKSLLEVPKFSMFAGKQAADWSGNIPLQQKYHQAADMIQQGHSLEDVWAKTGFYQQPSGELVWEISDKDLKWKNPEELTQKIIKRLGIQMQPTTPNIRLDSTLLTGKLSDFIDHPEVFRNYPHIANIDMELRFGQRHLKLDGLLQKNAQGQVTNMQVGNFSAMDNKMIWYVDPMKLAAGEGFATDSLSTFLHEMQHGIQRTETWTGGGVSSMDMMANLERAIEEDKRRILQFHNGQPPYGHPDFAEVVKIDGWLDEILNTTGLARQKAGKYTFDQVTMDKESEARRAIYERLQGEFQSRASQARIDLTDEQRAAEFPEESQMAQGQLLQDIPREGIIYSTAMAELQNAQATAPGGLLNQNLDVLVPRLQPSDFKRNNDGTYVGFNKSINTPQKITKLLTQLEGLAIEGADARMWYEDSSTDIMNLVNGDKVEAEKIAQILAITSQVANVKGNTGFALKAYAQHKAGFPIDTGRFPVEQSKRITDVLNGIPWEGRKTNAFYGNLMAQIDPSKMVEGQTTQDIWMARAFGLSGQPGDTQYQIMEKITQNIAAQNDWTPYQAQAAIWVATKARNESMRSEINAHIKKKGWGTNANNIMPEHQAKFDKYYQKMVYDSEFNLDEFTKASYNFADGIVDNLGFVSLEAVPSTSLNVLPGIHNAPPEQVAEFTKSMYSIFLDENGVDLLAKEIGMASPDNFMGFGGWEGDINPNIQVQGLLSGTIEGGINPADVELVELYASVVGTVFKQDGVSYRRAFSEDTVAKQNGVDVDAGRRLTKEEHEIIYDALQKQFGHARFEPTSTGTGVNIIQYPKDDGTLEMPNAKFKQMVKKAIMVADIVDVDLVYYRSEGDLIFNDWKENPNGESYQIRENRTEKSQNLYEQLVYKYSQEADTIRQEFGDKYGWGEVQETNVNEGLLKQTDEKLPNHLLE